MRVNVFPGIVFLVIGLLIAVFSKEFAQAQANYGDAIRRERGREETGSDLIMLTRLIVVAFGIVTAIAGVLMLLGVLAFH